MRIRKPRGITTTQLMITTLVGVIGGVYIYQPLILERQKSLRKTKTEADSPLNSSILKVSDQSAAAKYITEHLPDIHIY